MPNDGAGQCALFSIDQAERGTAESDDARAQQLRNELAQFYIREQRNPSRISGMTWEEFVLSDPDNRQNKQYGFAIATWAQYIASIRTRGTYIGVPELDALARLRSRYIVVVDPSGKVQTRHGDPAHEHILLRYALSHYELMRPQVRHLSHALHTSLTLCASISASLRACLSNSGRGMLWPCASRVAGPPLCHNCEGDWVVCTVCGV